MRPTVIAVLLAMPCLALGQYTFKNLRVDFLETNDALRNYTYGNLRLYPVYAHESFKTQFRNVGDYTALQEAVQKKKIVVTEKNAGGTVGELTVQNTSRDTIIIICGDVIKGGQQDRIVQEDIVLAPGSGKKTLKVFCVESGRWSRSNEAGAAQRGTNLSAAKKPAEFTSYYSKGTMSLRKVVEKDKEQSKVWSKVEEINTKNKTLTATKTYTAIGRSDSFSKKLQAYVNFFGTKFNDPAIIGVVVVSGKNVLGCDLFATHAIFAGQLQSLLHSYSTEAIVNGAPVTASVQTVKTYMDALLKDEGTQKETLKKKGTAFVNKGAKLRVSSFD